MKEPVEWGWFNAIGVRLLPYFLAAVGYMLFRSEGDLVAALVAGVGFWAGAGATNGAIFGHRALQQYFDERERPVR